jgi:hypothetical protein
LLADYKRQKMEAELGDASSSARMAASSTASLYLGGGDQHPQGMGGRPKSQTNLNHVIAGGGRGFFSISFNCENFLGDFNVK